MRISKLIQLSALGLICLCSLFLAPSKVKSAPITFAYETTIGGVNDPALNSLLTQTLRLEYSFESTTLPTNPGSPDARYGLGLLTLSVTVGGLIYSPSGPFTEFGLIVENDGFGDDRYFVSAEIMGPSIGGIQPTAVSLQFFGDTTVFADNSLPLTPPNPQDFQQANLRLLGNQGDLVSLSQQNVVSQPVPEPSTLLLFGAGLAGLIGWLYRRNTTT